MWFIVGVCVVFVWSKLCDLLCSLCVVCIVCAWFIDCDKLQRWNFSEEKPRFKLQSFSFSFLGQSHQFTLKFIITMEHTKTFSFLNIFLSMCSRGH